MTVCVAVKVYDCIVFAADSASSLVSNDPLSGAAMIANVYAHGNKVFNLRKGLPIAAMTCGMGNIGPMSIGTLAKELRERFSGGDPEWSLGDSYTMEEVATKARINRQALTSCSFGLGAMAQKRLMVRFGASLS